MLFYAVIVMLQVNQGSMSIVGVEIKRNNFTLCRGKTPAQILRITEKDSISEVVEITHSKADPFQDLSLVIAAFNKAV